MNPDETIGRLAIIARQIEDRELLDAADEIDAAMAALSGRIAPIHQSIFDAAVARAAPVSATTQTKLAYAINFAQNELGLLPVVKPNLIFGHLVNGPKR